NTLLLLAPPSLPRPSALFFLFFFFSPSVAHPDLHSFPTRRSSDLHAFRQVQAAPCQVGRRVDTIGSISHRQVIRHLINICGILRSEEHTSELQSRFDLVCRLLLEKKKKRYREHS